MPARRRRDHSDRKEQWTRARALSLETSFLRVETRLVEKRMTIARAIRRTRIGKNTAHASSINPLRDPGIRKAGRLEDIVLFGIFRRIKTKILPAFPPFCSIPISPDTQ